MLVCNSNAAMVLSTKWNIQIQLALIKQSCVAAAATKTLRIYVNEQPSQAELCRPQRTARHKFPQEQNPPNAINVHDGNTNTKRTIQYIKVAMKIMRSMNNYLDLLPFLRRFLISQINKNKIMSAFDMFFLWELNSVMIRNKQQTFLHQNTKKAKTIQMDNMIEVKGKNSHKNILVPFPYQKSTETKSCWRLACLLWEQMPWYIIF